MGFVTTAALAACISTAAVEQSLPEPILWALAHKEQGYPGMEQRNKNGSFDLGRMQINTVHLDELSEHYRVSREYLRKRLRDDECFNVRMAAWMLHRRIVQAGGDFWKGVGHYHSFTPSLARKYMGDVVAIARRLYGPSIFATTPSQSATPTRQTVNYQESAR